ncbi:3-oxoacyl-ACP reductase [Lipingzhangella sp. LS1_29]|uniref:3-oxoacyl-ACP reductase n=1 Tax=Lipingzhangella rawalii TaxID=2055835 RepID=A0ABU2H6V6_9ACTN|nr:3-oxoacyl-ACP reductase [Lipingzhangella rawalii]MDS1271030.1 3-oxoacyl-ACP reductase [Lipingzhangella rawalii]
MVDRYQRFAATGFGGFVTKRLGLPRPPHLYRHSPENPRSPGPVLLATTEDATVTGALHAILAEGGTPVHTCTSPDPTPDEPQEPGSLILDATGITETTQLCTLHRLLGPRVRSLRAGGRVLVVGTPATDCRTLGAAVAQRSLEGFTRALAKELRMGATVNLIYVPAQAPTTAASTVRFLVSDRSAYVSGQTLHLSETTQSTNTEPPTPPIAEVAPLADTVAVVTGAARGIGATIAETAARDGAQVLCIDVPHAGAHLADTATRVGGQALELDITEDDAPQRIVAAARHHFGRLDVMVHNAGITRDKTLARMSAQQWDAVLSVNLLAAQRITERLVDPTDPVLGPGGRVVCTSSISGIAGNAGQTNYSTSKAGLIGLVTALAPTAAERGATVNAIAPGFIETPMTEAMPLLVREAGRRMNSLRQGGTPQDVAEAVCYLADPGTGGVNGQVLRVCGQSLIGA